MHFYDRSLLPDKWKVVSFGDILRPVKRKFYLVDDIQYQICGVRWYGNGVFIRETPLGSEVKRKDKYMIKKGDVIYNKLFAWKGAFALVGDDTDSCCVSDKFPTYELDTNVVDQSYLSYYFQGHPIQENAKVLSKGAAAASKFTLNPSDFPKLELPLPPFCEQLRIVSKLDAVSDRINKVVSLQSETEHLLHSLLTGAYSRIAEASDLVPMSKIAPLIRRQVDIEQNREYPELGIRSFGKGTFHKPAITGADLGGKRIYQIEAGDLMFSNVFAWEGAIAVAKPEDHGRYGSHRFISRVPDPERATAKFLCFHFLSEDGLRQIQNASPGSAGRNRTLGLKALDALKVPVPPLASQKWFDALYDKVEAIRQRQDEVRQSLEALFPSILDKAFKGEL